MVSIDNVLDRMRNNPKGIRFADLCRVCEHYFGAPYRMPWQGDPRVNIQNDKGMAKAYQVRQVLKAIERLQNENSSSN